MTRFSINNRQIGKLLIDKCFNCYKIRLQNLEVQCIPMNNWHVCRLFGTIIECNAQLYFRCNTYRET